MADRLIELFADVLNMSASELDDSSSPDTVPEWDSLAAMNLVAEIEDRFKVRLTTREIMKMSSIALVRSTLQEKGVDA